MSECVLKLDNVSYGYDNTRKILDEVTYEFNKNVMYSIVGPSGSGKTTLLSLMGALDNPKDGKILYQDKEIKKIGYTKYRRKIAFVFQSYNLINYMSGIENVIAGMEISKSDWKLYRERISEWQEAYMEQLAKEYIELLNSDRQASEKFWTLDKRIRNDKRCTGVLVRDIRRSNMLQLIINLLYEEAIFEDGLKNFSQDL